MPYNASIPGKRAERVDVFERKIMAELLAWKEQPRKKKALVIKGLRQIGKTTTVRAFAEANYGNVVYLDFKRNVSAKKAFEGDLDVDRITLDLTALSPEYRFVAHDTVLIFDEVQECSSARTSVKSFVEDGRYDVICTGSLLGIKGYNRRKGAGVPVGFERIVYMKPMDFEEFCWAKGVGKDVIAYLRGCLAERTPVRPAVHEAMLRYFREYICVGGLPAVVDRFLSSNDMNEVRREQRDILDEYRDDFGKHLDEDEREETDLALLARIERVFDSIPGQLAKENKKFAYSQLERKGRSEKYLPAIQWLVDAGIVAMCTNLDAIDEPLAGHAQGNAFKLYMRDSGLFVAMLEQGSAARILGGELGMYKGAVYENIVADCLSKKGAALHYFHKDSGLEIDFVAKESDEITLVEVKATSGNAKSARTVLADKERYRAAKCIKLSENNIGVAGDMVTLPYYLAFALDIAGE